MFCIRSGRKFNRIDVLKLFSAFDCIPWNRLIAYLILVRGPLARNMSQIVISAYKRLSLFTLLLFAFFHFSDERDILNFRIIAVRDVELCWAL